MRPQRRTARVPRRKTGPRKISPRWLLLACAALAAAAVALVGLGGMAGPPAPAARAGGAPLSSAGQRYALVSEANGRYVTVETAAGDRSGTLRAGSTSAGRRETFTVHTADLGVSATLRSEATGGYVSAGDGADGGTLRASGGTAGPAERFTLVSRGSGRYALRSTTTDGYVTTARTGGAADLLRARATGAGPRETYRLVPVGGPTPPPAARTRGPATVSVMSWNICSNVDPCPLYRATPATVANTVTTKATSGFDPDVVMVQEFCEKDAKPLELALEAKTRRGWDVRFAPIGWLPSGTRANAQRICDPDVNGADRGSYGLALGLPDANTWYAAFPLPSPAGDEQRAALCGALEARALIVCASHFSSPGSTDDPEGVYRPRQLGELIKAVTRPGYRGIFGGDLNLTPPGKPYGPVPRAMNPAYDAYEECDQSANGGRRTGAPTYRDRKIDYIFGPVPGTYRCRVGSQASESDHRPIYATVTLPAAP